MGKIGKFARVRVNIVSSALCFICLFSGYSYSQSSGVMQDWSRRHGFVDPRETQQPILDSWQGGQWGGSELSGEFRFFVTASKNSQSNHLYVQWINAQSTEGEEVFYSVSIDELNSLPRYRFSLPRCSQQSCKEVKLVAFDIFEEKELEFKLVLEGIGQYRMKI